MNTNKRGGFIAESILLAGAFIISSIVLGTVLKPKPVEIQPLRFHDVEKFGTATGSGVFPTSSLNNFQDNDIINSGDWNALERKIGIDNSTDTTSLDYKLRSTTSTDPGHKHTTTSGGIGTSTQPTDSQFLISQGTNTPTWKSILAGTNISVSTTTTSVTIAGTVTDSTTFQTRAAETLYANDAVYTPKFPHHSPVLPVVSGGGIGFGAITTSTLAWQKLGVSFITPGGSTSTLTTHQARECLGSSPTDSIVVSLSPDNSGSPSSTVLASTTYAYTSFTGCGTFTAVSSSINYASLNPVTRYWIVYSRTTALDDSDNYAIATSSADVTDQSIKGYDGANWYSITGNTHVTQSLTGYTNSSVVYRAGAAKEATSGAFVGFAQIDASSTQQLYVQNNGVMTGFSGLTQGLQYFLGNTSGTISNASGTVSRKVGIAISSSSVLVNNNW